MQIIFSEIAWQDYQSWQNGDKRILKKINRLIKEIIRNPTEGVGKPEPLKFDLSGFWSRRIDHEHRIVYQWTESEILIYSCRYDK